MIEKSYWTLDELMNTAQECFNILTIMHQRGIIHGNLMPKNISCDI